MVRSFDRNIKAGGDLNDNKYSKNPLVFLDAVEMTVAGNCELDINYAKRYFDINSGVTLRDFRGERRKK